MNKPVLVAREDRKNGLEVWSVYDPTVPVYELFASEECLDYVGAVETLEECEPAAQAWFAERSSY